MSHPNSVCVCVYCACCGVCGVCACVCVCVCACVCVTCVRRERAREKTSERERERDGERRHRVREREREGGREKVHTDLLGKLFAETIPQSPDQCLSLCVCARACVSCACVSRVRARVSTTRRVQSTKVNIWAGTAGARDTDSIPRQGNAQIRRHSLRVCTDMGRDAVLRESGSRR